MKSKRHGLRSAGASALCGLLVAGCVDESPSPSETPAPAGRARDEATRAGVESGQRARVGVLFVRELGFEPGDRAQSNHDAFADRLASINAWQGAFAVLATNVHADDGALDDAGVHYVVLTTSAHETLRPDRDWTVLAEIDLVGLERFHIVSHHGDLSVCLGKRLATNHMKAREYVDRVAAGAFTLDAFEIVPTAKPAGPRRALTRGQAECALVNDSQLAKIERRDTDADANTVWSSSPEKRGFLVAFAEASAGERATLQYHIEKVCTGRGARICRQVGISALRLPGYASRSQGQIASLPPAGARQE